LRRLAPLALVLVLKGTSTAAPAEVSPRLSLGGYALALDEIRVQLDQGNVAAARLAARELRAREVEWEAEVLATDATALQALEEANTDGVARSQAARLARLARALRESGARGTAGPQAGEPALLARLALPADVARGGSVPELHVKPLSLPERVEAALVAAFDRVGSALRRLWDLLRKLWPQTTSRKGDPAGVARAAIAFVCVALVGLAVLAIRALRRSGEPAAEAPAPATSLADEDPLSRESSQWELHARELARAQRFREAIRAWYHAVLSALFRRGELHYRRGRTNWEYVATIGPEQGWRAGFIELTRLFDREWYGRRTSDREAQVECARQAQQILGALRGRGDA
jgi:hypothetical protein